MTRSGRPGNPAPDEGAHAPPGRAAHSERAPPRGPGHVVVLAAPPTGAELKKVLKSGDAAAVKGALEGGALDVDGVKAVLDVVEDGKGGARLRQLGVYWEALVAGLEALARGPALEEAAKAYKKAKRGDIRFLIVEALGKVPEAPAEATLVEALEDDDESVSVLAARAAWARRPRPRPSRP